MESEFEESPFGAPVKVVRLGKTNRTHQELLEFIRDELTPAYNCRTYHVLQRNCNHFTNEIVRFLLSGQQIPEEVLSQPLWAQNGPLAQILIPAMNGYLGGFGGAGNTVNGAPHIVHMSRAEKEREQKRLAAQWSEWVEEREKQRQVELDSYRKEAEDEEFTNWMLQQHQKMENEEKQAQIRAEQEEKRRIEQEKLRKIQEEKLRKEREVAEQARARERQEAETLRLQRERESEARRQWEQQNPAKAERRREAEQTLRDILSAVRTAEPAVLEWALSEAREAGVEFVAPFLIRDAEFALREKRRSR